MSMKKVGKVTLDFLKPTWCTKRFSTLPMKERTVILSRESGEEDLGAAGLLRSTYSAGPVSQT
jgi:hypothetical protein